jgi:anaerobic magnesium-protoporphyrin IX monomethyl ester cyclase
MIDCLFISPSNASGIYQKLSKKYSAIEPPTWALLLAQSCRSRGYKVSILDCLAENLSDQEALERIITLKPKLITFVVYGQNVNSGTVNMSGAVRLSDYIKKKKSCLISFIGSHVQALPKETLEKEKSIDFIFLNEGVYSLWNLLKNKEINFDVLSKTKGLAIKNKKKGEKKREIIFTGAEKIVPNDLMDSHLPGYAWDLLPFKKKPFDLYRSPLWHAKYNEKKRSPYAAIYTSLGCQFKCNFCMINLINKDDEQQSSLAKNYSGMRFWSTNFIIKEFDKLISMGVKTIRIVDEMFLLNPKYYIPLCEMLKIRNFEAKDQLNLWAYSRVDTIKKTNILKLVREAGIKWLCLGIESGNKKIRLEVAKGKFEDVDIKQLVKQVHESGIQIMANYIYGLPGDDRESIEKTFQLSVELNTLGWNTYAAMALPGSELYNQALKNKLELPKNYEGYSFHSFDTLPLPTKYLKPAEILKLRDEKYIEYHANPLFLQKVEDLLGMEAKKVIIDNTKIKLKRKLYS